MLGELMALKREGFCLRPFVHADAEAFACAMRESASSIGPWMPRCHAGFSVDEARIGFAIGLDLFDGTG